MATSYGVPFTTRPEIKGTFGVAASTHWLATAVAMRMLERGGNAFDAAVACAFTLQVVEPHLNGPGGEVPLILWSAKERRARVLCGQGTAPAKANIAAFHALGHKLVPGTGLLPATVPGAFDAWMQHPASNAPGTVAGSSPVPGTSCRPSARKASMLAFAGAVPCPHSTRARRSFALQRMSGTSPPGLFRCGSTTCSVNAQATAASKALPPRSRVRIATAVASQWVEAATPNVPLISGRVVKGRPQLVVI